VEKVEGQIEVEVDVQKLNQKDKEGGIKNFNRSKKEKKEARIT